MTKLGLEIKFKRIERNYTREKLAIRLGISTSLIQAIENGQSHGCHPTLKKISDFLKIHNWFDLYEGSNKRDFRTKTRLGEIIRDKRLRMGLLQLDVAKKVYVTTTCISHIELGKNHGSYEVVKAICKVLDIKDWEKSYWGIKH